MAGGPGRTRRHSGSGVAGLTLGLEGSGYTTPTKYALAALEERSRALARHRSSIGGQRARDKKREHQRDLVQEIASIKRTLRRPSDQAAATRYLQDQDREAWQTATDPERARRVTALIRRLHRARKKI
jgi:hypothetical protein